MIKPFLPALLTLTLSLPVLASEGRPVGPQQGFAPMTVAQVQQARDDSLVEVRGRIIKRLSDEEYELQDATGTLVVEIDDDLWHGLQVTDQDEVLIQGEVDQDWGGTELEAKTFRLLPL